MANENNGALDKNFMIAIAALSSVDANGKNEGEWLCALAKRASYIQSSGMLDEGHFLMNVLSSVHIPATITSVEFEGSSQRYVIRFVAIPKKNSEPQGEEMIRSPRMDNKNGQIIANQIEMLKSIAGTDRQVVIYKHNEKPSESTEKKQPGGRVSPSGYRTAVWFDIAPASRR